MTCANIKDAIVQGEYDKAFFELYGENCDINAQRQRYIEVANGLEENFGEIIKNADVKLFSVPGRSEVCGNHTDHNAGKVMCASVSLDIVCAAVKTNDGYARILSKGFDEDCVEVSSCETIIEGEKYKSSAIIRGALDGFKKRGFNTGSFCAYTASNVLKGSGLSSSAAFEIMVCTLINHFYNDGKIDFVTLSKISQYAENTHFGKPCGLMDQIACSAGGFVYIDFEDGENVKVERIPFDIEKNGLCLCITNTGGNHADLNEDYASVPSDMKACAKYLGVSVLRESSKEKLLQNAKNIRETLGDRCFLRALHFYDENERVERAKAALSDDNLDEFLSCINQSGISSAMFLQNMYSDKNPKEQGITLAIAIAKSVLYGEQKCAVRLHGGGFAGTIQSFVPKNRLCEFKDSLEDVFGKGNVYVLGIRKHGCVCVDNLL